jgi:SulP family sulfate permease
MKQSGNDALPLQERVSRMLVASALRESLAEGYTAARLRADVVAGITLGVIAIPLGMALAIATGVPPQYGLYAAIVGGLVIAASGGSKFNISGPTAAFVAILLPITATYGLGGLLLATVMAGLILVALGLARMGRFVEFIPYPVLVGFTAGIGVVIATLQVKDFFGLTVAGQHEHFTDNVVALLAAWPTAHWQDAVIGALALAVMLLWPRLPLRALSRVPAHLMALVAGTLAALLLALVVPGFTVDTIGTRFHWEAFGQSGSGIPPFPPMFVLPWQLPDAQGNPLGLDFALVRELLPAAFAIALLCAIESLLCAVVADGFAGTRHNPNAELVGQGLGNIAAPFFGGITCTAAIARTSANYRVGATSPVSSMVHALTVLLALVLLAPVMALVPMSALAALLLVVAWNMAEAKHFTHILRVAPRSDVVVLLTCFLLTVLFDMVLAVGVGIALAALLFIRRMTEITGAQLVPSSQQARFAGLPSGVVVYDINGPLFFGAARQALESLRFADAGTRIVILDMSDVPTIDMTGLVALQSLLTRMQQRRVAVVLCGLAATIRAKMEKADILERDGMLYFAAAQGDAVDWCRQQAPQN